MSSPPNTPPAPHHPTPSSSATDEGSESTEAPPSPSPSPTLPLPSPPPLTTSTTVIRRRRSSITLPADQGVGTSAAPPPPVQLERSESDVVVVRGEPITLLSVIQRIERIEQRQEEPNEIELLQIIPTIPVVAPPTIDLNEGVIDFSVLSRFGAVRMHLRLAKEELAEGTKWYVVVGGISFLGMGGIALVGMSGARAFATAAGSTGFGLSVILPVLKTLLKVTPTPTPFIIRVINLGVIMVSASLACATVVLAGIALAAAKGVLGKKKD